MVDKLKIKDLVGTRITKLLSNYDINDYFH